MKVIKVGTSAQSRIAQACDRCRSKKIRCDGIRPCCSQCANVGFECKTSDKLSRRAFPRGYTESLEERVRALEAEVRELKDLLDEKDEKIDMLSKMHSNLGDRSRRPSSIQSASPPPESRQEEVPATPKEDIFRVQASPLLLGSDMSDSYFMGASSGRAFVGKCSSYFCIVFLLMLHRRVQEKGSGEWEVTRRPQYGSFSQHPTQSAGAKTNKVSKAINRTSTYVLRQMRQRLLPRMGTTISCSPQADLFTLV